ncbi:hypothetical protein [Nitrosomonas marina]|uniref:Uncharacterized protein n=1 Tax=Nitrosomonas marina TaxID=917 RepID=A0A1H8IHV1_9PROT|nr:hypothetical protein [Nitrosomonas marina]SEN68273.1 hypothetical protein SAMN05216325_13318 [Nitrosomonas marina]
MNNDIPTAYHVMFELWERSSSTFTAEKLKYFAGAIEQVEIVAENLQGAVSDAAYLLQQQPISTAAHDMPDLLLAPANQLDTIHGLPHIGASASYRLRHPELFEKKIL